MTASVIVIGAGPGIGAAVARRFAGEGFPIALIARHQPTLDANAGPLRRLDVPVATITTDSGDEQSLRAALDQAITRLGPPQVATYNTAVIRPDQASELTMPELLQTSSMPNRRPIFMLDHDAGVG